MKTRVIHHTTYGFPLDPMFFGQTFVIGDHTKNSSLETAVSTLHKDTMNDFDLFQLDRKLAFQKFFTKLIKGNIHHEMWKASEIKDSEDKERFFGLQTAQNGRSDYMKLFLEWVEDSRLALAFHYFKWNHFGLDELKRRYGNKTKVYLHLHCMAEMYFGNLNRAELSGNKNERRDRLHRSIDSVNPTFVAVSDAVKRSFMQHNLIPEERIVVVKNGVSSDLYNIVSDDAKQNFRRDLRINASKLVGYVGRISPEKGSAMLLSLLRHYEKNPADIGFVIASSNGEHMDRFIQDVQRYAPTLIEQDKLKFCVDVSKLTAGLYSRDKEVSEFFLDRFTKKGIIGSKLFVDAISIPLQPYLDVYLQPSNSEALSLSVLEAIMSGIPVIASNVGGLPEIVSHNNGNLIDVDGRAGRVVMRDFVDSIEYWINNPMDSAYAQEIRSHLIRAGFDAKTMAKKLDEVYQH